MKAIATYPVLKPSGTVIWRPALAEPKVDPVVELRPAHQPLCLECKYAELYAEQPRARCRCAESVHAKQVVFAGQMACAQMSPRDERDLTLASYSA